MINYFDSIKFYKWKLKDIDLESFNTKVKTLDWRVLLLFQVMLTVVINYFSNKTLMDSVETQALVVSPLAYFLNLLVSIGFLFLGYYFTTLFFKTELSVFDFYRNLIYIYLPILLMITGVSVLITYFQLAVFFYFFIFYYVFKELNLLIYSFSKEFNAGQWALVGVVVLWALISSVINYVLGLFF